MTLPILSVWAGLLLAAAALWTVHPLLALIPAAGLVALGLLYDDGGDE